VTNFNQVHGRNHERAESAFKKGRRQRGGRNVMTPSEIEADAVRQKTERLRALRLARDAVVVQPAPAPPAAKKRPA
jgi:hypothetical protein